MKIMRSKKRSLEIGFVMAAALFLFGAAGIAYAGSSELASPDLAGINISTPTSVDGVSNPAPKETDVDSFIDQLLTSSDFDKNGVTGNQNGLAKNQLKDGKRNSVKKQSVLASAMDDVLRLHSLAPDRESHFRSSRSNSDSRSNVPPPDEPRREGGGGPPDKDDKGGEIMKGRSGTGSDDGFGTIGGAGVPGEEIDAPDGDNGNPLGPGPGFENPGGSNPDAVTGSDDIGDDGLGRPPQPPTNSIPRFKAGQEDKSVQQDSEDGSGSDNQFGMPGGMSQPGDENESAEQQDIQDIDDPLQDNLADFSDSGEQSLDNDGLFDALGDIGDLVEKEEVDGAWEGILDDVGIVEGIVEGIETEGAGEETYTGEENPEGSPGAESFQEA